SVVQETALFYWAAGGWVTVDQRPATQVDQTVTLTLANPGRFVEPGTRRLRAEVRYRTDQPTQASRWSASVDRVAWTVGAGTPAAR
ncbi:MAG TPA: hypothetical protein VFO85_13255, partial [Vicinamibacteria bacterium]|nr:hypothetical protein [Vicinamibacteria bacterium]